MAVVQPQPPAQAAPAPEPVKKSAWPRILLVGFILTLVGLGVFIFRGGYMHPDPTGARCNEEWAYWAWQRFTHFKAITFGPFGSFVDKHALFGEPGVEGYWTGGCIGRPPPLNWNIVVSISGIFWILAFYISSVINLGFSKRRWTAFPVLMVVTLIALPHYINNLSFLGDKVLMWRALWFFLVGLGYCFVSNRFLDDPPPPPAPAQAQVVQK